MVIDTNPLRHRGPLREWWAEIVTVRPHRGAHWPALRVGIAVTLPLAALLLAGRPEWSPYAVFGSLGAVYGKHHGYQARLRAQTGVSLALMIAIFLGTVVGIVAPGSLWAVAMMTAMSVLGYLLSRALGWLPVPALFLVFAVGTISSYQHSWSDLPIAVILSALAALLAIAVGQLGRLLPKSSRDKLPDTPRVPLRVLWATPGLWVEVTAYGLGPLLAGSAATLIGIGHPYWAAVSATVPLSGATLAARIGRASLRLGGTVVGIGIAFAILNASPARWVLVLAVAVCQIVAELFVARNYGIAVIAITPLALILSYLGSPSPLLPLLSDRLVETFVGVAVAGVILLVLRWWRNRPPRGKPDQPS